MITTKKVKGFVKTWYLWNIFIGKSSGWLNFPVQIEQPVRTFVIWIQMLLYIIRWPKGTASQTFVDVWVPWESCSNSGLESVGLGWGLISNKLPGETQFQGYKALCLDPEAPTVPVQEKGTWLCSCASLLGERWELHWVVKLWLNVCELSH